MPWAAGFQTDVIGVEEARLVAIQSLLQDNISSLDATLQLSPLLLPIGTALTTNVIIGDPYALDSSKAFLICVCAGGGRGNTGMDLDSTLYALNSTFGVHSLQYTLHSRILVYVHPDTFPVSEQTIANVNTTTENAHRMVCRICDWIRCLFATQSGVSLALDSLEYSESGDEITEHKVTAINVGDHYKGPQDTIRIPGAEILLAGVVQGSA